MTEYETNPRWQQPGAPDTDAPDRTVQLPRREEAAAALPDAQERSDPPVGAPAGPPAAEPYAPPPGQWQAGQWQQPGYAPPAQSPPIWAPPGPGGPAYPTTGAPFGTGVPGYPDAPAYQTAAPAYPPGPAQPSGRTGRRALAGVAVLALAVGSGIFGGWVALAAEDEPTTATAASATSATNSEPAPVINRDDLANVAAAVQPSVVSIRTERGEGSGVVYDTQGDIVTNNHVVATARGSTVEVSFNTGKKVDARIVGTDPRTDLAVVKVSDTSGLAAAKFGDSGAMRVGDTVLALGSPLGLEGTVTAGIISALDRTIDAGGDEDQSPLQQSTPSATISGLLQTDAPINPGNSGGALANTKGEVIGINSAIATSGNGSGNIGVGFAIPSNKVKTVADQLISGGKVSHPVLGVSVGDAPNGALVQSVVSGSPAAKAGIQEGDVITKLGGKAISDSDDLVSAVQAGKVGDKLELTYSRNGAEKTATVTLAEAS